MSAVLEAILLVCFGLSWPISAIKAWKVGTAAGTSWMFLALITLGYVAGIAAKFVGGTVNWVLAVYFLNLGALIANWLIFARTRMLDAKYNSSKPAAVRPKRKKQSRVIRPSEVFRASATIPNRGN